MVPVCQEGFEKEKMSTLKQLDYLLDKKTKLKVFGMFVMILIGSAAELLGITIILPIVNLAMDTGDYTQNTYCKIIIQMTSANSKEQVLLWLIGITIVLYILKNLYLCWMHKVQYHFSAFVRMELATKLMSSYLVQSYSYFLNVNSSELIRGVTTDVDQLFQLINNILSVASNGITAIAIIVFLAISNIWMTLTIALILGICLCIIIFGLQRKNRKNGRLNQYYNGQLTKHLRQAFEGVKEIKIMNTEKHFIGLYKTTYEKIANLYVKYSLYSVLPKYMIELFAILSILGYLGINIIFNPNYMTLLPQLAVFCVAAYKLLPSVNAMYASFNMLIYYKASIDLVYHDIKEADELDSSFDEKDEQSEMSFEDKIVLENVSFKYDNTDKDILSEINISIPKGKSVAFIGPSGGGKTTTADIVLNLLNPYRGTVKIDGVDVRSNENGWKRKIGYIPQAIYLTDDTIRANVAFGVEQEEVDDEKVWGALRSAQLETFVKSLPDGLDTMVGERGARISGGQKQRIGIARALYRDPEVLVFDEATSALDNETEKEVMRAIEGLQGTKTILMIAHRLSTIEKCDIVYKVENGTIVRER
ncbi:MAG: ABC transporter ATP-binding protein/permease [Lachnospiraceae bacterium]|nr:ABC transporter ATP-binding protein/permease [Lachnospiraceae bacterium]